MTLVLQRRLGGRPVRAEYVCMCGVVFSALVSNVTQGKTKSCGCLRRAMAVQKMAENPEAFAAPRFRHGMTYSPTHNSWTAMIQRCTNVARGNYRFYGARGIAVCDRWRSFDAFLADMGERPEGTTLDRIDGDGNYEPGNCRWASKSVQMANRRPRGRNQTAA